MIRSKIEAIQLEGVKKKPIIIEALCSGCGICVNKCPFHVIFIINLPDELERKCSHRFGQNTFKLHGLPIPQSGAVIGLIGKNGIGKTTILKILAGEIKPNLGKYQNPPDWKQIITHYRGSLLQKYFTKICEGNLKVILKPQYVDKIPKVVTGKVGQLLEKVDEKGVRKKVEHMLQLKTIMNRPISVLSGGELQRVAIGIAICQEADVYLFDEPTSYLDVKQRIGVAKAIRSLTDKGKAVLIAEHDLAVLDYLSDQVYVLYGEPSVFGVTSYPHGVRVGINIYLEGYLPDMNVRFRDKPIKFHVKPPITTWDTYDVLVKWGDMKISYKDFTLSVKLGDIHKGEVIGILGPNGIGKTTFIKLLAGTKNTDGNQSLLKDISISYKPQYISAEYEGKTEFLLRSIAKEKFSSSWYKSTIIKPLSLDKILDREITKLSGGELQRVAIAACLSKRAQIYLLDEPSAYLDIEERLAMAKTIRGIVKNQGATAFVVEHDVVAQDFIADRIMVFSGEPGIRGYAHSPTNLRDGMNVFLSEIGITFRRDSLTKRPRVNKEGSRLDKYQKKTGEYYYMPRLSEEEQC